MHIGVARSAFAEGRSIDVPTREVAVEGRIHPAFGGVADELRKQLSGIGRGGAAVCVYHRGEPVVDVWAGTRDVAGHKPWLKDTLAFSFSTTKGVVATLAHVLAEKGELDLAAPVTEYWPEFGAAGKSNISVSDLLTHRAGLHLVPGSIGNAATMVDWASMTSALAASPANPLGDRSGYHALTFGWLVGEIIRRVTKQSVGEAIRTHLAGPLEASDLLLGAPQAERSRLAELMPPSFMNSKRFSLDLHFQRALLRGALAFMRIKPETIAGTLAPPGMLALIQSSEILDAEIPALNGVFTARSLARVYAMLAGGGELDNTRLLSRSAVERAGTVRVHGSDAVLGLRMRWRLGYHLVGTSRGWLPHAFGHFGYGGSGAWADPTRGLSMAMTLNRVAGTPVGDWRMLRMSAAVVRAADARDRRS